MMTEPHRIQAQVLDDLKPIEEGRAPRGAVCFICRPASVMAFVCPMCGDWDAINLAPSVISQQWSAIDIETTPTVVPEIKHRVASCNFVGYLRKGIWIIPPQENPKDEHEARGT